MIRMSDNADCVNRWLAARVPGASFDEAGSVTIASDTDKHLLLELSADRNLCHFCAVVGPLDTTSPMDTLIAALELNRFGKPLGGCWLAWEPDIDMLTLCSNLEIAGADEIAFGNALDNFIVALGTARAALAPYAEAENSAEAELRMQAR